MSKVINKNGTEIDYESALMFMDEDILDGMAGEWYSAYHPMTDQEWFTRYETLHEQKYGEEWELSKANPPINPPDEARRHRAETPQGVRRECPPSGISWIK